MSKHMSLWCSCACLSIRALAHLYPSICPTPPKKKTRWLSWASVRVSVMMRGLSLDWPGRCSRPRLAEQQAEASSLHLQPSAPFISSHCPSVSTLLSSGWTGKGGANQYYTYVEILPRSKCFTGWIPHGAQVIFTDICSVGPDLQLDNNT